MTKDRTLEAVKRKKTTFYKTKNMHSQNKNSTEKLIQNNVLTSEILGFIVIQIYIKYKNLKVGLCEVACPFYVQKDVMDTG